MTQFVMGCWFLIWRNLYSSFCFLKFSCINSSLLAEIPVSLHFRNIPCKLSTAFDQQLQRLILCDWPGYQGTLFFKGYRSLGGGMIYSSYGHIIHIFVYMTFTESPVAHFPSSKQEGLTENYNELLQAPGYHIIFFSNLTICRQQLKCIGQMTLSLMNSIQQSFGLLFSS